MKHFFTDTDEWKGEAVTLEKEARYLIKPLLDKVSADGYSLRQAAWIITDGIFNEAMTMLMAKRLKE